MALLIAVLIAIGVLFIRSVRDTRAEPYTLARAHLDGWSLAIEPAPAATSPMLVLRVPRDLVSDLSRQIFRRLMDSLTSPVAPVVPLVLRAEYDRALVGRLTPETLLEMARDLGLESAAFEPVCLGYRRVSAPRDTRQLYFALFDVPAFVRFRERLAEQAGPDFDPAALSPVVAVSASDDRFDRWFPLQADRAADCVAPISAVEVRLIRE